MFEAGSLEPYAERFFQACVETRLRALCRGLADPVRNPHHVTDVPVLLSVLDALGCDDITLDDLLGPPDDGGSAIRAPAPRPPGSTPSAARPPHPGTPVFLPPRLGRGRQ